MRIKKTSQYIEGGAGLPSYFTTETDTGMKWIDGKTIYRKVITGSIAHDDTLMSNIDTFINAYGSGFVSNRYRIAGFCLYLNNALYTMAFCKNSSNQIKAEIYNNNATTTATNCNIVLEYTKSS